MRAAELPVRELYDSAGKLIAWLLFCAFLIWGAVMMILGQRNAFWFGLLCLAVLVPVALSLAVRFVRIATPVIAIDGTGILDRRVAQEPIRWAVVQMVTPTKTRFGIGGVQLVMSDEHYDAIRRSRLRQLLKPLRKFLSPVSGVGISALGVQISGQELFDLCLAYSRLHKSAG